MSVCHSPMTVESIGRVPCSTCGMIANTDPAFHQERYAHAPTIRWSDGRVFTYDGDTDEFVNGSS